MKKSDFETGMRIEIRNIKGKRHYPIAIVLKDLNIAICSDGHYHSLNSFTSKLKVKGFKTLDIMKIYDKPVIYDILNYDEKGKLLWERKEKIILTLDDIEYSESTLRSIIKKAQNG